MNYIFGAVYAAAGVYVFIQAWRILAASVASRSWRTTSGVIVFCEVESSVRSLRSSTFYSRAEVAYKYEVDGYEYVGERARFGEQYELGWLTRRILRRYPKGAHVVVHYDPHNPSEAVLEPGITPSAFGGLFLGVLVTVFGVLLMFKR